MPYQPRVAILVPAPDYAEKWQPAFARKAAALTAAGFAVEHRVWTDPGDLAGHDLIMPLFAWGYQRDVAAWYGLLDRLAAGAAPVVNPVPVLRWNSDKAYLADLAAKGVAVVPTVEAAALDAAALADARKLLGVDEVVIKPAISGGADGTHRIAPGAPIPVEALGQRRLVQPLMPGILTEGEFSLFFFGGRFSHAIVKRPAAGDFRVQEQFGGRETAWEANDAARTLAAMALAAVSMPPVYARVDMVSDAAGRLHVMELELIEPSLFLHHAPDTGAAFAQAVYAAL
jgi:glutathione synthase/RimK-type ligase-like ATP-grasp enzyme